MPDFLALRASAILAFILSVLLSAPTQHAVRAQGADDAPNVMVILDASRSMWGQIDGVNKVVSAHNAINAVHKQFGGKLSLGVVAFGHRNAKGCKDIEVVLEPAKHKASNFTKKVNTIKPKGSTPIAASLTEAAEALGYKEKPASILLIADGLDNCKADPCATAANLKQQGKDLTIHAIGFDAKAEEKLSKLSCIAKNAGGTFTLASNESELNAGVKRAIEAAIAPKKPKVAAALQPKPQARPQPQPRAQSPASAQQQQPAAPPASDGAMPKSDPLTTGASRTPAPENDAPAQAAAPPAARSPRLTPTPSRVPVPVTLAARTAEGGAVIKSGVVWWIYKNAKNKDGAYPLIDTVREATPTAKLPPGSYRIAATYGKVNLIREINVKQGPAVSESFVLNAGGLRLGATTVAGAKISPNSIRFDVFADETESDQYGNRKLIVRDAKPGIVIRLNAGAYQVVSTYGDANAIVRANVTVEPGRLTDAIINHSGAKVTLKLVNQPGGEALANTQWNILTPGGDVVKESAGALPTHILAAGNYSVLARHQGKDYTREFEIEPGDVKEIEVVVE